MAAKRRQDRSVPGGHRIKGAAKIASSSHTRPGEPGRVACADLHCHTTCSDGLLSPADLVARAAAHGVDLLAVTDLDTTAGIAEARRAAAAAGVTLVPGVEISVSVAGRVVHV